MNRKNTLKKLKPVMIAGTCSDAGKSVINAGLCRIFLQDGYHPAPFKAQNMSLNSYATPEGLEIGRAQAVQAEACGIACHVDMNPVLLKPTGDLNSQVIIHGKPVGNRSAREYFITDHQRPFFDLAFESFVRLKEKYSPIVMEGAGSVSELNLKKRDIVNMPMAERADASVILVADIDRGGVFASVYGTVAILEEKEQARIKGVIINKFRGDIALFEEGKQIIEKLTNIPVLGVIPWFDHIQIDDEDSVVISKMPDKHIHGKVNVGVIRLPHLSNFTDFYAFKRIDGVNLFFSDNPDTLLNADILIIPGTKNTIADLKYLKSRKLDDVIRQLIKKDKSVIGICGGFQMMGQVISDPEKIEGDNMSIEGLGIFPVHTVIEKDKVTRQVKFFFMNGVNECKGYEIHMGKTSSTEDIRQTCRLVHGTSEGVYLSNKVWGSYIHGIFDNAEVLKSVLLPYFTEMPNIDDYRHFKERQYDLLADHLRKHLDMEQIYHILNS